MKWMEIYHSVGRGDLSSGSLCAVHQSETFAIVLYIGQFMI